MSALDEAILRHRADPTDENRAAVLAAQRQQVDAVNAEITACLIARSRGEHSTGGCPQCG